MTAYAAGRPEPVREFMERLEPQQRELVETLRRLIRAAGPDLREDIKWGHLMFSDGRTPVCYLAVERRHLRLGFMRGSALTDPERILEGSGKNLRHGKLRSETDIRPERLKAWIRESRGLNPDAP